MSIRDEVKEQQDKMKDKDFKEKWDYFWEYYKFHVLTAVVALIFIISGIKNIIMEKDVYLSAILLNSTPTSLEDTIGDDFLAYAGVDTSKYDCAIDTAGVINKDNIDEITVATSQKITAHIAAEELDIFGADFNYFFQYAGQDVFLDLSTIYSEKELENMKDDILYVDKAYIEYIASDEYQEYLTSGKYDENNKYAVMCAEADKTGSYTKLPIEEMKNPVPVGIIINNSKAYEKAGLYSGKTPVVGIIANSKRTDAAKKFIEFIRTE